MNSSATIAITTIIPAPVQYAAATPLVAAVRCAAAPAAGATAETLATTAPRTAMPMTPPTCRTVCTMPLAWLRCCGAAAPSASVVPGEIVSPMPVPIAM